MFGGSYIDWNQKKIKNIIDIYGIDFFKDKKILDLGCGHAEISSVLQQYGANVTAVDSNKIHLKLISKKFPTIKTVLADLDNEWPFTNEKFDIVLDISLICCLSNYEEHIKNVCNSATHLILETAVCDSDDPKKFINVENKTYTHDGPLNGISCRPSSSAIEKILTDSGMTFQRYDCNDINSGQYVYDWVSENNDTSNINKRRFWFCVKQSSNARFPGPILDSRKELNNIISPIIKKIEKQPFPRIAVCISGHMRTFESTYRSFIDNVILPSNEKCDVFIHTWETMGSMGSKLGSDEKMSNIKTETQLSKINEIINPKKIIIDSYEIYNTLLSRMNKLAKLTTDDKNYLHNKDLIAYSSMLYGMDRVKKIFEDYENEFNFKYDIVIRLRTDLYFTNKLIIKNWNLNSINIPNIGKYYAQGMNDQFAVGNSQNMKIYLNLFDKILDYINNRECLIKPEVFLKHHLTKNSINISDQQINFNIIRPDGRTTTQTKDGQYWSKK